MERPIHKNSVHSLLSRQEIELTSLDMEVTLNGRPLSCIEEHLHVPILSPNAPLFSKRNLLPGLYTSLEDSDVRKRARYMEECNQAVFLWTKEYFSELHERRRTKVWQWETHRIGIR